jgi:hypothetical protein
MRLNYSPLLKIDVVSSSSKKNNKEESSHSKGNNKPNAYVKRTQSPSPHCKSLCEYLISAFLLFVA